MIGNTSDAVFQKVVKEFFKILEGKKKKMSIHGPNFLIFTLLPEKGLPGGHFVK